MNYSERQIVNYCRT